MAEGSVVSDATLVGSGAEVVTQEASVDGPRHIRTHKFAALRFVRTTTAASNHNRSTAATEEERGFDAIVIPRIRAAGWINAADEEATRTIGAEGREMRGIATARARTATSNATATCVAHIASDARTSVVPLNRAAVIVDRADILATRLVVAIRVVVRIAAGPCFWRAALRLRAGAIGSVALRVDLRFHRAELIPRDFAADHIEQADRSAAHGITTRGGLLRFAARTCAIIAAVKVALRACSLRPREIDARLIPLHRAAVVIHRAHCAAATRVVATWSSVHFAAATAADVAAVWHACCAAE